MKLIYIADGKVALLRGSLPQTGQAPAGALTFTLFDTEYAATAHCPVPDDSVLTDIRSSWSSLGDKDWQAVAKATEIFNFYDTHKYCVHCGAPLTESSPISRKCTECGQEVFAPMYPCIMVLVTDGGDRALIVRSKSFKRNFYGLVAGFVETGESLEECVAREVREETGLEVEHIKYIASQSWPFPAQLMIGFTARLKTGTIVMEGDHIAGTDGELADAAFFSRDNLPPLASHPSLARRLIERWLGGETQ
ncbi:MAG: NAD(+) diphosphatase [Muribaculum sp.]|nr:NAD(+) diphosphatase [Muribaculum sp.]